MTINDILYRDDALAKREAEAGMHHTMFWSCVLQRCLLQVSMACAPKATDFNAMNGAHYFTFDDPITGKAYDVRIKPREKKA